MPGIDRPMGGRRQSHGGTGGGPIDPGFMSRLIIGRWLAEQRHKTGLTGAQLGEVVGIGAQAVSNIECGRNPIRPEHYEPWAQALGVNRKAMGRFILEHSNPWLFALLYGEDRLGRPLGTIPDRGGPNK